MSAQDTLGKLLTGGEGRDAIHIALSPAIAAETLRPGDRVGFVSDNDTENVRICHSDKCIGIVDPFLGQNVRKGQKFWMFLLPNTISSLRHEWEHPAFANAKKKVEVAKEEAEALAKKTAREWITSFAASLGSPSWDDSDSLSFDQLMKMAEKWVDTGEESCLGSTDYQDATGAQWAVFWKHFETLTGKSLGEDKDTTFFRCSC